MMESKYVKLKYHEHHIIKIKMATGMCLLVSSSPFLYLIIQNTTLGAKFDDASVALGAALLDNQCTDKVRT